jgi:hypothetical protein
MRLKHVGGLTCRTRSVPVVSTLWRSTPAGVQGSPRGCVGRHPQRDPVWRPRCITTKTPPSALTKQIGLLHDEGEKFSEAIVDHESGKIAKAEPITGGRKATPWPTSRW